MSDISPETTSSSGSRRRQIFPENLSRSSTSQQQGYERANMAPSPSAVDGRAAITQGCASARNELNKRAPAPHVPPAARDSAAARSRRAGHPARSGAWGPGQPRVNGWCSRGQATTRAPQPPNAALITRVLRPYPALSRSRPLDVNPRARARARRPMAGAGAPYARVPARRPGRDVLSPRWLVTRAERRDGEHTIMDFTRQFSPFTPLFFCLVSRRITMGHRFDREFCFYVSFFVYFCRDIFFLRITMGA
jgi:hypothetical protein